MSEKTLVIERYKNIFCFKNKNPKNKKYYHSSQNFNSPKTLSLPSGLAMHNLNEVFV